MSEQFMSPAGYWIVVAPLIGASTWYVRVLDFGTWKHRRMEFSTEILARQEGDRWRL